jgi:cytochrome c biogenesis protein CcmG/thiol:disulfide interchange protein DsbE
MKAKILVVIAALAMTSGLMHLQGRASKVNVGKSLPAMELTYLGTAPTLKDRPLIVEFWATWCPPCRATIPHLNDLYQKYHPKGLEAVGITEEDAVVVKAFQKDVPMDYPVGIDKDDKVGTECGIVTIPHALLVDKTGKVVWEGNPADLKESQLEELVK